MEGVEPRGKGYQARKRIPDRLREAFGKREFKKGLRTRDMRTAHERAIPLLREWERQIDEALNALDRGTAPSPVRPPAASNVPIDPAKADEAIQRWRIT